MIAIILNGPGDAGKGTFLEILRDCFDYKITKYSSITWAKMVATKDFKWDGETKGAKEREMIGQIHRLGIQHGNIPFEKTTGMFRRSFANWDDFFVTDVREPSEIKKYITHFKRIKCKCLTIRIQNTEKERYADKHLGIADQEYAEFNYDLIIPNNGTIEDFRLNILNVVKTGTFNRN